MAQPTSHSAGGLPVVRTCLLVDRNIPRDRMDQEQLQLERAKLAMEEYKVLHAELLQRSSTLIQIVTGSIAAIVALIGLGASGHLGPKTTYGLIILVLAVIVIAWHLVHGDARKASSRIIEIEEYVNQAVGGNDKNPLSGERRFGLSARK